MFCNYFAAISWSRSQGEVTHWIRGRVEVRRDLGRVSVGFLVLLVKSVNQMSLLQTTSPCLEHLKQTGWKLTSGWSSTDWNCLRKRKVRPPRQRDVSYFPLNVDTVLVFRCTYVLDVIYVFLSPCSRARTKGKKRDCRLPVVWQRWACPYPCGAHYQRRLSGGSNGDLGALLWSPLGSLWPDSDHEVSPLFHLVQIYHCFWLHLIRYDRCSFWWPVFFRELDPGLQEAVSTLIWAAPRLQTEVSELKVVSTIAACLKVQPETYYASSQIIFGPFIS